MKMTNSQYKSVQCLSPAGLHRMAYQEWGDADNPRVLVCVHGLTRVSNDFDALARALCDTHRVVCPDIVGRGRSDWLVNPQYYQVPQYISDMVTLLARLDAHTVHWLGTSMGGLIGMGLAALPQNPVGKLLLNDVGSVLNAEALARIGTYLGQPVQFATVDDGVRYIRTISASFGPHSDDEWHKLATDVLRQDKSGQWILHYDPRLALPFKAATPESTQHNAALLNAAYDAITCPTLVVRGEQSDLLSREVAQAMTQRGPRARLVELPGIGHAPTFIHADQIALAKDFFLN